MIETILSGIEKIETILNGLPTVVAVVVVIVAALGIGAVIWCEVSAWW